MCTVAHSTAIAYASGAARGTEPKGRQKARATSSCSMAGDHNASRRARRAWLCSRGRSNGSGGPVPHRLIALYRNEPDDAFRERYAAHGELCRRIPGLAALRSGRVLGSPAGRSEYRWYSELEFADEEAF